MWGRDWPDLHLWDVAGLARRDTVQLSVPTTAHLPLELDLGPVDVCLSCTQIKLSFVGSSGDRAGWSIDLLPPALALRPIRGGSALSARAGCFDLKSRSAYPAASGGPA